MPSIPQTSPAAFTYDYHCRASALVTRVDVRPATLADREPEGGFPTSHAQLALRGLWDTGASHTNIAQHVAGDLGLAPVGGASVHTAGGPRVVPTYNVSLFLPNGMWLPEVSVVEGDLRDIDVLIGMDIIGLGDLAITTHRGVTVVSFVTPSLGRIDFVKTLQPRGGDPTRGHTPTHHHPRAKPSRPSRGNLCACGSGKLRKNCCGKA